ncbi:GAF domain-containing protein [Spirosoma sp. HMF4905]|uniref:histidine kinase n=1 Tax=Spirosoma arboris TaxID=2682092 RepID=A0A7K1SQ67_9BACT|nr:ATP-binding protein [Spirosoma arboris]MVM35955.1 GAF domain-containing protein [Spirosoma arboris]
MIYTDTALVNDIERVGQIPIISTLLDVVCQTTGMGFAAIARVTQDRWIACSVRDEIQFGLKPGGELKVETTICDQIRDTHQAVIIDHVETSEFYCNHPTPAMYGFQSYISVPIILKNGDFFGTLCAIDPRPALLNNSKVIGMFTLFVELIAFHLQQIELLEQSQASLETVHQQLSNSLDENRQYRHISNHNLQEPLRKIRVFSGMLIDATEKNDLGQAKIVAARISSSAQRLSMMIKDVSSFTEVNAENTVVETVNLGQLIEDVRVQLKPQLTASKATFHIDTLPSIQADRFQMEQLFYHLLHNAVKFAKKDVDLRIEITANELPSSKSGHLAGNEPSFIEIRLIDNGIGIEKSQLEKIFNMFSQVPSTNQIRAGEGIGLAYCRKIVRNHSGRIEAKSEIGQGTTMTIQLPIGVQ